MKFSELKDVQMHWNETGNWPLEVKVGFWAILVVVVLVLGYIWDISYMMGKLDQARVYETSLKGDFEVKYSMASNLTTNESQMELLRRSFSMMLQQLPSESAIGDLLEDISQIAVSNGLAIDTFRPGTEERKNFYYELPIKVKVTGTYHQFGHFVSDLASLPRVVTVHDIRIYRDKSQTGLVMEMSVHSYRYIDDYGAD